MTQQTTSTVRLGLMPPLTGLVALYGSEIVRAARIACEEINEQGGVLGRPLELIIEDDGSLPDTAVPAAERLIDVQGCVAMIGNLLSNSRIAVADRVAGPRQVPYLNFSFYEGSINEHYFFHFAALPNQQIDRMIPYTVRHFGQKIYFAGSNYEWPRGSIDAAKQALLALGGDVVGEEYLSLSSDSDDLDALLNRLAKSGADVFIPYFAGSDQVNLLTRFTQYGLKKRISVVMGHFDEAIASCLSPEVREGFYSSNTYFMSVDTPENHHYLKRLAALPEVTGIWPQGNGLMTNFGEGAYLCVHAFARAAEIAQSLAADDLVAALEQVTVNGPQGSVHMDSATHHAHVNTFLARCNADGAFTIIENFGCNPPQIPERYRCNFAHLSREAPILPPAPMDPATSAVSPSAAPIEKILAVADIAIIAIREDGIIIQANYNAVRLFGYDEAELIGLSVHLLTPPQFRHHHQAHIERFIASPETAIPMGQRGEVSGYRKDGSTFPAEASITKVQDNGEWILVASLRDITERQRIQEELMWKATHDSLTQLPNRALIRERLTSALKRSKRQGRSVALLFIDLDGFKIINDSHGHDIGDELLISTANRLVTQVRPGDTVGRLGGDEFLILCEQIDEPTTLSSLAERLNNTLREPFIVAERTLSVTASIGIAIGHGSTFSADDLLRYADSAMYSVKERGRDSWQFFNEDLHEKALRRVEVAASLRNALEQKELRLLCQPIVAISNGAIRGAELLLRWSPPEGEVSPAFFIPIAEMTGSILPIGAWVFEQACRMEVEWRHRLAEKAPYISVNLSTRQLDNPDLPEQFSAFLNQYGADASRILLEITETSLMSDVESNLRVLRELAKLGLRVAVDDFGTGYSSLSQLLRMPVQTLKIDCEFIDGLDKRHESRIIASAVISMANALGLETIAEGVENIDQLTELKAMACDYVQGFYFYRPMPEPQLLDTVEQQMVLSQGTIDAPIYFMLYVSKAIRSMETHELKILLDQAQAFNTAHGLTGFLLYQHGQFMQMIEGRREIVLSLVERIRKDLRHTQFHEVMSRNSHQRVFPDWSMGFRDMNELDHQFNFSQWRKRTINFFELAEDAQACYSLITAFR